MVLFSQLSQTKLEGEKKSIQSVVVIHIANSQQAACLAECVPLDSHLN